MFSFHFILAEISNLFLKPIWPVIIKPPQAISNFKFIITKINSLLKWHVLFIYKYKVQ